MTTKMTTKHETQIPFGNDNKNDNQTRGADSLWE